MEAKRKEQVVTSSSSEQREESGRDLSWKDASREEGQEGRAGEEGPQGTAQSQGNIQGADQGDNPTTSAGDAEVPPGYASSSFEPSSSDGVAVPSTTN